MHGTNDPSVIASARTAHPDFTLGDVSVHPATRTLEGPAGVISTEPRIMQVLCELADAGGGVVTREGLLARCWPGMLVGDDALNRAIFELRRALSGAGASVSVETIPKTGYRLAGLPSTGAPGTPAAGEARRPTRRLLLGGLAGVAAVGGAVVFELWPSDRERRAAALVERADMARRDDLPDAAEQGVAFYRAALKLTPDDAAIWGKLALALCAVAEYATPAATTPAVTATEQAARRALDLQPGQPDARVALAMLPPHFAGWFPVEEALRGVLADAPDNLAAQANLSLMLMEVGRVGDGAAIVDRLIQREPLAPAFQYRHVYQLWARGRLREADQVADRALQLWPRHSALWLSRFWTFALTGRAAAALAMIDGATDGGPDFPPELRNLLRLSGKALLPARTTGDVQAAIAANVAVARAGQFGAVSAILVLPQLGAIDTAFDIVEGYLLREGPMIGSLGRPAGQPAFDQQTRRHTAPLWMPSAARLRADPRFVPLCAAIGLADYWRKCGHGPDYLASPAGPRNAATPAPR